MCRSLPLRSACFVLNGVTGPESSPAQCTEAAPVRESFGTEPVARGKLCLFLLQCVPRGPCLYHDDILTSCREILFLSPLLEKFPFHAIVRDSTLRDSTNPSCRSMLLDVLRTVLRNGDMRWTIRAVWAYWLLRLLYGVVQLRYRFRVQTVMSSATCRWRESLE